MKILAVGGGSGGHVTPVVAVLRELKKRHPKAEIRFWCDFGFAAQSRSIMRNFDEAVAVQTVFSGKLRRYHHLKWWQYFLVPSIILLNIRDIFLIGLGLVQSIFKLLFWRPDVVFAKGGFVCVPVGIAAHLLRIPIVIHDSDSHPGLANRILARFASAIATGAPLHNYPYDKRISRYVGVPVSDELRPYSEHERALAKEDIGFNPSRPLVVITGGGQGSQLINNAVIKRLEVLLEITSVLLLSGTKQYDELRALTPQNDARFQLHDFISEGMPRILGAADIVVARAGVTTILELSALAKPTILIPNGMLTGGHQLKNAAEYTASGAVELMDERELEANPQLLVDTLGALLANSARLKQMGKAFYEFAKPNAARDMADIIEHAGAKNRS